VTTFVVLGDGIRVTEISEGGLRFLAVGREPTYFDESILYKVGDAVVFMKPPAAHYRLAI
jgi:hypothetical protein